MLFICRLKKDRKTFKDVPLFGIGMLHMIDHFFWNLPFASPSRLQLSGRSSILPRRIGRPSARSLRGSIKRMGPGTYDQQLRNGWKQWLGAAGPQAAEPARVAPASLATPVYVDT